MVSASMQLQMEATDLGSDDATGGARLTFSDHAGGSFTQKGFIVYKHSDGSTSGNPFDNYFFLIALNLI